MGLRTPPADRPPAEPRLRIVEAGAPSEPEAPPEEISSAPPPDVPLGVQQMTYQAAHGNRLEKLAARRWLARYERLVRERGPTGPPTTLGVY
jgi:hypothetical protein